MYRKLPRIRPPTSRVGNVHRTIGVAAFVLTLPIAYHCAFAYGVQTDLDTRVAVHSLAGCFFYGAFAAKLLIVRSRRFPGGPCPWQAARWPSWWQRSGTRARSGTSTTSACQPLINPERCTIRCRLELRKQPGIEEAKEDSYGHSHRRHEARCSRATTRLLRDGLRGRIAESVTEGNDLRVGRRPPVLRQRPLAADRSEHPSRLALSRSTSSIRSCERATDSRGRATSMTAARAVGRGYRAPAGRRIDARRSRQCDRGHRGMRSAKRRVTRLRQGTVREADMIRTFRVSLQQAPWPGRGRLLSLDGEQWREADARIRTGDPFIASEVAGGFGCLWLFFACIWLETAHSRRLRSVRACGGCRAECCPGVTHWSYDGAEMFPGPRRKRPRPRWGRGRSRSGERRVPTSSSSPCPARASGAASSARSCPRGPSRRPREP